ncbi:hypothetical protein CAPTEDRAFT_218477 [Capitella teleta]|uniref:Uncharacterized protein n=1 Tax=Capitella teleta TaxID=283909 RepID=R7VJC5_CAPTE|nr:hypothetical protein CAPTEDRAFT_218477 [Capitella teleta]|eukprot:ELU18749.1 hypothetical protein CAPTEDRAFT_218477 [Capitella teleta]
MSESSTSLTTDVTTGPPEGKDGIWGLVAAVALGMVVILTVSGIYMLVYIRNNRSQSVEANGNIKSKPNVYETQKGNTSQIEPHYDVAGPITVINLDDNCNTTTRNQHNRVSLRQTEVPSYSRSEKAGSAAYASSVLSVMSEPMPVRQPRASGFYSTSIQEPATPSECGTDFSVLTTKSGPPLLPKPKIRLTRFDSDRNTTMIYSKSVDQVNVLPVHGGSDLRLAKFDRNKTLDRNETTEQRKKRHRNRIGALYSNMSNSFLPICTDTYLKNSLERAG